MNRLIFTLCLISMLIMPQAWGATTQYPNPYRQTIWNNMTDGVHTFGQNAQQTQATLKKLHNARTNARLKSISHASMAKFRAKRQAWINNQNN